MENKLNVFKTVSLYCPGWPSIHSVAQVGVEFSIPASFLSAWMLPRSLVTRNNNKTKTMSVECLAGARMPGQCLPRLWKSACQWRVLTAPAWKQKLISENISAVLSSFLAFLQFSKESGPWNLRTPFSAAGQTGRPGRKEQEGEISRFLEPSSQGPGLGLGLGG